MSFFIIVASVFFAINITFLTLSLIYTIYFKNKITPRPSLALSVLSGPQASRRSHLPQVMLYHTIVRLSQANVEPLPQQTTWQKLFGRKNTAAKQTDVALPE